MIQNFSEWLAENYGMSVGEFQKADIYTKNVINSEWDEYLNSISR